MWTIAKIVAIVVIFFLSLLSGIISCVAVLCLQRKYGISGRFNRTKSLLTCFSGGIFFATSILSLLPEAREKMEEAFELWEIKTEYPLTEVLVGTGFLLLLGFENVSYLCCAESGKVSESSEHHQYENEAFTYKPNAKIAYSKNKHDENNISEGTETVNIKENSVTLSENVNGTKMKSVIEVHKDSTTKANPTKTDEHGSNTPNGDLSTETEAVQIDVIDAVAKSDDQVETNQVPTKTKVRGIVLLVALSFHMVFDGLALGLLDEDKKVWTLLLGLCIHKVLVFLSIGIETFEILKSLLKSVVLLFCFALVSPIGIMIGMAVTENEDELSQSVASAVLQSIATGTFIYVTFFEILQREYEGGKPELTKVICTVIGFALIAGVKVLEGVDF